MILPSLSLAKSSLHYSDSGWLVSNFSWSIYQTYVNQFHASALFIENNVQTSLDTVSTKIPSSTSSLTAPPTSPPPQRHRRRHSWSVPLTARLARSVGISIRLVDASGSKCFAKYQSKVVDSPTHRQRMCQIWRRRQQQERLGVYIDQLNYCLEGGKQILPIFKVIYTDYLPLFSFSASPVQSEQRNSMRLSWKRNSRNGRTPLISSNVGRILRWCFHTAEFYFCIINQAILKPLAQIFEQLKTVRRTQIIYAPMKKIPPPFCESTLFPQRCGPLQSSLQHRFA